MKYPSGKSYKPKPQKKKRPISGRGKWGKQFEELVMTACAFYHRQGDAKIDKVATPVKVLQTSGRYITKAVYEEKSTVDFVGSVKGGRSICFDAKTTSSPRISITDRRIIRQHQLDYLRVMDRLGAISFILLEFAKEREYYVMPYKVLECYIQKSASGGKKSISLNDCMSDNTIIRATTKNGYIGFLEALREGGEMT